MTEQVQVRVTDRDGRVHTLHAPVGAVLMEVLRDAGFGVEAVCGGCCACATCHVYIDSILVGQPSEMESALVATTDAFKRNVSRLSCQIELHRDLDTLELQIAPEE